MVESLARRVLQSVGDGADAVSGSRGGLGAFDMALLPEVFVPVSGHGLSSDEWLAPRRRLLTEMLEKGWLTLWPDLDEAYLSALHGLLCDGTDRGLDETAQAVLSDLVEQVQTRRYARSTNTMPDTYNLGIRSEASKALAEAHSKLEFDVVMDCRTASGLCPISIGGDRCNSIEEVCDRIARLLNADSVLRDNKAIAEAVLPMARRFPCVTVTGKFIGPRESEGDFPVALLTELMRCRVSVLRKYRVEFEGKTLRNGDPPLAGRDLRHAIQSRYKSVLDRAMQRGVVVEIASWPEGTGGDLLDRHVVVGTKEEVHSGLTISHLGVPQDDGDSFADIIVMRSDRLNRWNTSFREHENWRGAGGDRGPELQAWPAVG